MVDLILIPRSELQRISRANRDLVDAVEGLLSLYEQQSDLQQKAKLKEVIARLLSDSNAISSAVQSTAYVAASG